PKRSVPFPPSPRQGPARCARIVHRPSIAERRHRRRLSGRNAFASSASSGLHTERRPPAPRQRARNRPPPPSQRLGRDAAGERRLPARPHPPPRQTHATPPPTA